MQQLRSDFGSVKTVSLVWSQLNGYKSEECRTKCGGKSGRILLFHRNLGGTTVRALSLIGKSMAYGFERLDLQILLADLPEDPKAALGEICERVQTNVKSMDGDKDYEDNEDYVFVRECICVVKRWCEKHQLPVPEEESGDLREVWKMMYADIMTTLNE